MQNSVTVRSADDRGFSHGRDQRLSALGCGLPDIRLGVATQHRAPPLHELPVLLLDDRGVARQRPANLEVLTFDDSAARATSRPTTGFSIGASDCRGKSRAGIKPWMPYHQQLIVEAHEEARLARIALPAGASPQLQVDSPALVPIRADHVQAAKRYDTVAAQANVGASTGHVRRDRDRPELGRLARQWRPPRRRFSRSALARNTDGAKSRREALRFGHRRRADEHGTARGMRALNLVDDRVPSPRAR